MSPTKNSKFAKRFHMIGAASSDKLPFEDRSQTPSTTASEFEADENQWIKRPPVPELYDSSIASDPLSLS